MHRKTNCIEIFGPMLEIDYDAIIAGSGATIECEHKIVEENALTKRRKPISFKLLIRKQHSR